MSGFWTDRITIPVVHAAEFAELSACYQEALKDRGTLECTYKFWSEMNPSEKAKGTKNLPSMTNNLYIN